MNSDHFPTNAFVLSEDQVNTIVHSMRVAADRFDYDATVMGCQPIAAQFKLQALQARQLADRIELAVRVTLGQFLY